jgi:hypothetical protein
MQRRHAGARPSDAAGRRARGALGDPARVRERIVDDSGASALDALRAGPALRRARLRRPPGSPPSPCSRSPSASAPTRRSSAP